MGHVRWACSAASVSCRRERRRISCYWTCQRVRTCRTWTSCGTSRLVTRRLRARSTHGPSTYARPSKRSTVVRLRPTSGSPGDSVLDEREFDKQARAFALRMRDHDAVAELDACIHQRDRDVTIECDRAD